MSATPSTTPTPAVDLSAGKDLTALDDSALLSELGFDPAPEGAGAEPTADDAEADILGSVTELASEDREAPDPAPVVDTPESEAPTAEAAPAPETPNESAKPLAAQFAVFDDEGELEIPDLKLTFTADGGKEFKQVPLDKVVRLAQQGVYNHRLQTEVQEARETQVRLEQERSRITEIEAARDRAIALAERLLTDETFFESALTEYQAYNAPDAVIARQRAEIEALRNAKSQPAQTSESDQAKQFFDTKAAPVIQSIASQFSTVTGEELIGKFMLLTAPLQVNGRVPVQRLADVERIIVNELAPWAQHLHEDRAAEQARRAKAVKDAERAKLAAATQKRQLARAIKPAGRASPDVAPRRPSAGTADDEAAALIADIAGTLRA
jgi:hypothetical protein